MTTQTFQPKSFKAIVIIYYALFVGQALLGLVIFFLMQGVERTESLESPFNIIIPGAVALGIIGAYYIGQYQKNNLPPMSSTADEKLEHFRRWSVARFAIAESGNLASLVLAFLFGSINYMTYFVIGLAAYILLRPIKEKFIDDYKLGQSEAMKLQ